MRDFGPAYVRFGSKADIAVHSGHVRFTPESGHRLAAQAYPASLLEGIQLYAAVPGCKSFVVKQDTLVWTGP